MRVDCDYLSEKLLEEEGKGTFFCEEMVLALKKGLAQRSVLASLIGYDL